MELDLLQLNIYFDKENLIEAEEELQYLQKNNIEANYFLDDNYYHITGNLKRLR